MKGRPTKSVFVNFKFLMYQGKTSWYYNIKINKFEKVSLRRDSKHVFLGRPAFTSLSNSGLRRRRPNLFFTVFASNDKISANLLTLSERCSAIPSLLWRSSYWWENRDRHCCMSNMFGFTWESFLPADALSVRADTNKI